ncbi:hypothetical protein FPQ18DRAFT_414547 [Pyronema domesticum]|nr:hypothetical protein FPQ18DRAFT_414547 [Pyronema domesticum]
MEGHRAGTNSIARGGLRASLTPISVTSANAESISRRNGSANGSSDTASPDDTTGDGCSGLNQSLSSHNHDGLRNDDDKDETMDDFCCASSPGEDDLQADAVPTSQWIIYQGHLFKLRSDIPDFETEEELHMFMLQEVQEYERELNRHRQDPTTHPAPSNMYSLTSDHAAARFPQWVQDYEVQDLRIDLTRRASIAKAKLARGIRCCQAHEGMVGRWARS